MSQTPSNPNQQPFNPQYPQQGLQGQPSSFWGNNPPQGYPQSAPQQNYQQYQQQQYQQPMMPPPVQPPKKKAWYKRLWGIVLIIFLALAACGGISNAFSTANGKGTSNTVTPMDTPMPTDTPAPTDTPTPQPSNAFKLATIDAGGSTPDAATVANYQTLLDSLHKKTGDSEQTISDETVAGQQLVKDKYSKDISLLELLQNADAADPGNTKLHYNELLAAYITLAYGQQ